MLLSLGGLIPTSNLTWLLHLEDLVHSVKSTFPRTLDFKQASSVNHSTWTDSGQDRGALIFSQREWHLRTNCKKKTKNEADNSSVIKTLYINTSISVLHEVNTKIQISFDLVS